MRREMWVAYAILLSLLCAADSRGQTVVSIVGDDFHINGRPTYEGRMWNGHRVEGLLFNNRVVQGTFDDLNPETAGRWKYPDTGRWDAERNNREFLAAMPEWKEHGLLGFTVNFQGGSPEGYSRSQPWENHPFNDDGSLRPEFAARMKRILDEADRLGMAPIVGYFYFGQSGRLKTDENCRRATDTLTKWLLDGGWQNLLVEINNESNPNYNPPILRPDRVHELIERVRDTKNADGRRLLVGTSFPANVKPTAKVIRASDFLLLHGNSLPSADSLIEKVRASRALAPDHKIPVVINEDDHNDFYESNGRLARCLSEHVSWGWFDWRRPGEGFDEGYQSAPVNWRISSHRKRDFFNRIGEVTGAKPAKGTGERSGAVSPNNRRPNIIVVYTDDHGWADLGAQQIQRDVRTPNLDALAAGGVRAVSGYVTAPQCVPSRAGLLSGRYQNRFGVESNGESVVPFAEQLTIAERLQKAGYATGMAGKWHLGSNDKIADHGFDKVFLKHSNSPGYWNMDLAGNDIGPSQQMGGGYHLDLIADFACAFIKRHRDRPFFFYLAPRAPHTPLDAPEEYTSRFPGEMPERRRQALAMISAVDDGVGRIMATLREYDLEERTMIFVMGDNGAPLKIHKIDSPLKGDPGGWDGSLNAPMNGEKGMLSEGGIRVPWLAYWKGTIPPGQAYRHPVISLDVAATAAAAAGISIKPGELDGVDLIPHFTGENHSAPHETIYWRWVAQSAVREGKWKLLIGGERSYLYDLDRDPDETRNQLANFPDVAERLRSKLEQWGSDLQPPGIATRPMAKVWENYYDYYLDGKPAAPPNSSDTAPKKQKAAGKR